MALNGLHWSMRASTTRSSEVPISEPGGKWAWRGGTWRGSPNPRGRGKSAGTTCVGRRAGAGLGAGLGAQCWQDDGHVGSDLALFQKSFLSSISCDAPPRPRFFWPCLGSIAHSQFRITVDHAALRAECAWNCKFKSADFHACERADFSKATLPSHHYFTPSAVQ